MALLFHRTNITMQTQLYFWEPLIKEHQKVLSLVEDYYRRTTSVFADIDKEAERYGDEVYQTYAVTENTDPAAVADLAQNRSLERYEALSIMKSNHLLMTISMLYHLWEQQLLRFTANELRHYLTFDKKTMSFTHVQIIFRLHGVDILETKAWTKIRELKFLANTVKHGDGDSADKLRKSDPNSLSCRICTNSTKGPTLWKCTDQSCWMSMHCGFLKTTCTLISMRHKHFGAKCPRELFLIRKYLFRN